MNVVVLTGRLTKDPELRKTQSGKSCLMFSIGINRRQKDENGNYISDFINCVCWNNQADYLGSYAHKGDLIGIEGSIQTRNYEGKNGIVYVTEVLCNNVSILSHNEKNNPLNNDKLEYIPEGNMMGRPGTQVGNEIIESDDLPFYGG